MTCLVRCKSGKYTYVYESESYRGEDGNPRARRKCVGRVDPKTNEVVFKPEYLERVWGTDKQPQVSETEKIFSVFDVKGSTVKNYGVNYLLSNIADKIGLTEALQTAVPKFSEKILTLAKFMIASGDPAMYCHDWLEINDSINPKELSSQRISELLLSISNEDRLRFHGKWAEIRKEHEFLAIDITSISSYSELIGSVEWGYNRDHEKLPQVNICMLVSEESKLPVFEMMYNGSLNDVSTLRTTLSVSSGISLNNMSLVMDKGFASQKNINAMLNDGNGTRFIAALPLTMNFVKEQINMERKKIDNINNTIIVGDDGNLRGVTQKRIWNKKSSVFTHIYFNPLLACKKRDKIYAYVSSLKEAVLSSELLDNFKADIEKYLIVTNNETFSVTVKEDLIEKEIQYDGWMVIISNFVSNAKHAIKIYRDKDVVEKTFLRLKNFIDLSRLRVHSDIAAENKIFIGFIALILTAHINKVMSENELYATMSMKELLKKLETHKIQYIKGKNIIYPSTTTHKLIYSAFGLSIPM